MIKTYFFTLVLVLITGALLFSNASRVQRQQTNNRAWVYAVCEAAHSELNGSSEKACGDAQDKTNSEFLCTANTVGSGQCWVEVK